MLLNFNQLTECLGKDETEITELDRENIKETYIHIVNNLPLLPEDKERLLKKYQ